MTSIAIAQDFSRYPGGRYREHGRHSGQEFREDYLMPALEDDEVVVVNLDGTEGYGSSFLEEAFGGLVRAGISSERLRSSLTVEGQSMISREYVAEVWQYIDEAGLRVSK